MRIKQTLSKRLILYFLTVMLVPFIIFLSFYILSGEETLTRVLTSQADILIETDAGFIKSVIEDYRHKSYLIATNSRILTAIESGIQPEGDSARAIYSDIYSVMSGDTYLASLSIVSSDGNVRISTHEFPEKYDTRTHSNAWDETNIISLAERNVNKHKPWFISLSDHRIENGHQIAFSLLRRIGVYGYAIIDVYTDAFSQYIGSDGFFSDLILTDSSSYQAYSLLHPQNHGDFSSFPALKEGENLIARPIADTDLSIVGVINMENVAMGFRSVMFYFLLSLAAGIVVSVLLTIIFSRSISKRFSLITSGMKRFEKGDFTTKLNTTGIYEFDHLSITFNIMVKRIETLIERQREEEAKRAEAERKALESQLNPHFLFNTLSTIKALARLHGEDQIYTIAVRLGKLLRYTIDNHAPDESVKEALDLTESYLMIQEIRFGDRLHYSIECYEKLSTFTIPRLIIQPLAENAVIHGLEEKTGEWNINIAIREDGNKVVITVADNGLGFDTSKLSATIVNEGHTGLYNIRRRLELRYGTNFLFEIHSEIGKGTEIRIELPKEDGR